MIVVEGKLRGKQRPRFNTKPGRVFTPKETITYENWIKSCYIEQCGEYLEGAIKASIYVYYKIPKSYTKKRVQAIREGKEMPLKTPDADNCAKIVLDSLNSIAYRDDSQIVSLIVVKRWTEENERIEFRLDEI